MKLDFFELLEEPLYLFAAVLVPMSIAALFVRRGLSGDAARFGVPRYLMIAGSALWFMLSPVAPLLGFAAAILVACSAPLKEASRDPSASILLRGVFGSV